MTTEFLNTLMEIGMTVGEVIDELNKYPRHWKARAVHMEFRGNMNGEPYGIRFTPTDSKPVTQILKLGDEVTIVGDDEPRPDHRYQTKQ